MVVVRFYRTSYMVEVKLNAMESHIDEVRHQYKDHVAKLMGYLSEVG